MDLEKFYPKGGTYPHQVFANLVEFSGNARNEQEAIYFDGLNFYLESQLKKLSLTPASDSIVRLGIVEELNELPSNPVTPMNDWIIRKLGALKNKNLKYVKKGRV